MKHLITVWLMAVLLVCGITNADTKTLSYRDSELVTWRGTYILPNPWHAAITAIGSPVPQDHSGVIYDITIYGAWEIEIGVGTVLPAPLSRQYKAYIMEFTNVSLDDSFCVGLYVKTEDGVYHYTDGWGQYPHGEGGWQPPEVYLFPGESATLTLDLSNLRDIVEVGVVFNFWVGADIPYANGTISCRVKGVLQPWWH